MKRVAFAWQTFWYDFDTLEEALKYVEENMGKHHIEVQDESREGIEKYIRNNGQFYTVVVFKAIGNYNTGY